MTTMRELRAMSSADLTGLMDAQMAAANHADERRDYGTADKIDREIKAIRRVLADRQGVAR